MFVRLLLPDKLKFSSRIDVVVGNPFDIQFAPDISPHVKIVLCFRRFEPGDTDSSIIRASSREGVGDYERRSHSETGGQEYK